MPQIIYTVHLHDPSPVMWTWGWTWGQMDMGTGFLSTFLCIPGHGDRFLVHFFMELCVLFGIYTIDRLAWLSI